jgi:hypothetical protein
VPDPFNLNTESSCPLHGLVVGVNHLVGLGPWGRGPTNGPRGYPAMVATRADVTVPKRRR